MVSANVLRPASGNARAVLEERRCLLDRRYAQRVASSLVHERRVGSSEHDDRVDIDVLEVAAAGLAACDDALDGARVPTELGERRAEGLPPLRVPLGPVDINEPAGALDVDEVDGVRRDDSDVDLECLTIAGHLEVVQDEVARWQVIP